MTTGSSETKANVSGRAVEILSHIPLSGNPRVKKEALALSAAGFSVRVLTSALPTGRVCYADIGGDEDGFQVCALNNRAPTWALWRHRLTRASAALWPKAVRRQVSDMGSAFTDLLSYLKSARAGTLRIVHLEPAMLAAHASGVMAAACCDFEDWYTNDLLPGSRSAELLRKLREAERRALETSLGCWCTSEVMADALVEHHDCRRPIVIRNVFPVADRQRIDRIWKDRSTAAALMASPAPGEARPEKLPVSIHWFSQTIGPGRGLEELLGAAAGLRGEFELHLRGDIRGYGPWLKSCTPASLCGRVHVHATVPADELLSRITEHDVGFAGERPAPPSRDLTITNKFFQYLQAGLAVVATATAGQKEAAAESVGAVSLIKSGAVAELRAALQALIDNRAKLAAMRAAAWDAGGRLRWENEAPKLVEAVEEACGGMRRAARGERREA